ncbi:MAG: hypothetical protein ACKVT0_11085 [Planctomycetaceae bacterium]
MSVSPSVSDLTSPEPAGLLCTRDLMFYSQVSGMAQLVDRRVVVAQDLEGLYRLCREHRPVCLFLDLMLPGLVIPRDLPMIIQETDDWRPTLIGFGPHVDVTRLREAQESGCHLVLPRSRFASTLRELLLNHICRPELKREAGAENIGENAGLTP